MDVEIVSLFEQREYRAGVQDDTQVQEAGSVVGAGLDRVVENTSCDVHYGSKYRFRPQRRFFRGYEQG